MCVEKQAKNYRFIDESEVLTGNCKDGLTGSVEIVGEEQLCFSEQFNCIGKSLSIPGIPTVIPDNTEEDLVWNTASVNLQDDIYQITESDTKIVVSKSGVYKFQLDCLAGAASSGDSIDAEFRFLKNDGVFQGSKSMDFSDVIGTNSESISMHFVDRLSANDEITFTINNQYSPVPDLTVKDILLTAIRVGD